MRLENKFHKWFKFILKSFPILLLLTPFLSIFTTINVDLGEINNFGNLISEIMQGFTQFSDNGYINELFSIEIFSSFNIFVSENLFNIGSPWFGSAFTDTLLVIFEYWLIIDFIDLIFSAFRFIIDIAHSWLDGFYTRSKRGGK